MMDRAEAVEGIRVFSKAVFGNRYRLEILAAIGSAGRQFYVQELSSETGIPAPTVSSIVQELAGHAIRPLPRLALNAPQYFERDEHPVFEIAVNLLALLRERSGLTV
jgi:hypothetical protein